MPLSTIIKHQDKQVVEFAVTLLTHEQIALESLLAQKYVLTLHTSPQGKLRGIIKNVKIDGSKLIPNTWNPNHQTARVSEATGESLAEFGQVIEVITRPHPVEADCFEIIDGEHRHRFLQDAQVDINVMLGLSDAEAQKLTIVMDGTRGEFNKIELAQLLATIEADLCDQTGIALPYTNTELEELIKLADVDWEQFTNTEESAEGDGLDKDETGTGDDEWVEQSFRVTRDAFEQLQETYERIEKKQSGLPKELPLAWGVVIEAIAAHYLEYNHAKT